MKPYRALSALTVRAHRLAPRPVGYLQTAMFVHTRGLDRPSADLCPLGARRVDITGVPRVATAYLWGDGPPTVLALHGWGTDSTVMSAAADTAAANGAATISFDAPGHGVSPGSQATITEYADAVGAVLHHFPSIRIVVAHSLAAIAAAAAIGASEPTDVRDVLLLAPACSLAGVLRRWSAQRGLPPAVTALIADELFARDGVPVAHWDVRTLGVARDVRVHILHDPEDRSVPIDDARRIAAALPVRLDEVPGAGHHGIVAGEHMRVALMSMLRTDHDQRKVLP